LEAIIITAIIVAGVVGLAWVLLHFGYKAWLKGHEEEAAVAPETHITIGPVGFGNQLSDAQLAHIARTLPRRAVVENLL